MPLPDITHLQFLVLGVLVTSERPGRYVRDKLREQGERKSGPAFYQLMARLEDMNFVKGSYDEKIVEGQRIKERWYRITGHGIRAWQATRDFYMDQAKVFGLQGGYANA